MKDLLAILDEPGSLLLDSSAGPDQCCYLYRAPLATLSACRPCEVPEMLRALDAAVSGGRHAAGYLGYESGYAFEPARFADVVDIDYERILGYPLAWFGLYEEPVTLASSDVREAFSTQETSDPVGLTLDESPAAYDRKLARIKELIRDGDVYQINFTGRLSGHAESGALRLYALMRRRQPVAFGAFVQLGRVQLLSASPERFIDWSGSRIEARPMKGTAPRGSTAELDGFLADWLQTDPKSRAENLMIVDLLRNDLSVVCEPGSVQVSSLFEIETYDTLLQMTSTVTGSLTGEPRAGDAENIGAANRVAVPDQRHPGAGTARLLPALFPCGSVTGAPKIRAMRRILELESSPRGIYCGAIGRLTPSGEGSFNVAIRTLSHIEGAVSLGSGGGIVWDSDSAEEYREALLKSRFLSISDASGNERASIEILETMRWERGIPLRDRHLARLAQTAVRLGFTCPSAAIVDRLDALDAGLDPERTHFVRLLLGPDGSFRVETAPLDHDSRTWRIGISGTRVHSGNPFLTVKTTYRGLYEAGRREAARRGLDEVVFLNERDELTEGTITNIFMRIEGDWLTPPLSSGLLPGLGREMELGSERHPKERVLRAEDLIRADAIRLTNALRGTIEAEFAGA